MSFALLKNELCERVGYQFSDSDLLENALTHASTDGKEKISYQRLEFLGDRVLGLVISDLLIRTYDNENEGELSRRLSGLVDKIQTATWPRKEKPNFRPLMSTMAQVKMLIYWLSKDNRIVEVV